MNDEQADRYINAVVNGYKVVTTDVAERSAEQKLALRKAVGDLRELSALVRGPGKAYVCGHLLIFCRYQLGEPGFNAEFEAARKSFESVEHLFAQLNKEWSIDAKSYGLVLVCHAQAYLNIKKFPEAIALYQKILRARRVSQEMKKEAMDHLLALGVKAAMRIERSPDGEVAKACKFELIKFSDSEAILLNIIRNILANASPDLSLFEKELESASSRVICCSVKSGVNKLLHFIENEMSFLGKVLNSECSTEDKILHIVSSLLMLRRDLLDHSVNKLGQFLLVEMFFVWLLPQIEDYFYDPVIGRGYIARHEKTNKILFHIAFKDDLLEELKDYCARLREDLNEQIVFSSIELKVVERVAGETLAFSAALFASKKLDAPGGKIGGHAETLKEYKPEREVMAGAGAAITYGVGTR